MTDRITDAHVELRDQQPIVWIARYTNTDDGPELVVMRIDGSLPIEQANEQAQFFTPPTAGDGFQLVDPDRNERIAFLTTAQLRPEIDETRPLLQLTAVAINVFRQPDWPVAFGSYDPKDPLAGIYASLNTPASVVVDWVEGSLLRPGALTVDDIVGRQA